MEKKKQENLENHGKKKQENQENHGKKTGKTGNLGLSYTLFDASTTLLFEGDISIFPVVRTYNTFTVRDKQTGGGGETKRAVVVEGSVSGSSEVGHPFRPKLRESVSSSLQKPVDLGRMSLALWPFR